ELSWAVTNATDLALQADGGAPVAIDPGLTKLSQVITGDGQRVYTLIARNGGETAKSDVRIAVTKPMKIDSLTVSPNPVFRNVKQDITIDWKTEGTTAVRFQGVEALTGSPDPNMYASAGQVKLTGTPRDT